MENLLGMFIVSVFMGSIIMLIWGIDWGWHSESLKRKIIGKIIFAVSVIMCVCMIYLFVKCAFMGSAFRTCCG